MKKTLTMMAALMSASLSILACGLETDDKNATDPSSSSHPGFGGVGDGTPATDDAGGVTDPNTGNGTADGGSTATGNGGTSGCGCATADAGVIANDSGANDSGTDAGSTVDGGSTTTDSGGMDCGPTHDAGTTTVDAGVTTDAGSPVVDAGTTPDSGTANDAGTTADAGTAPDGGTVTDAGTTPDSGTSADASTDASADTGTTPADAGTPADSGVNFPNNADVVRLSADGKTLYLSTRYIFSANCGEVRGPMPGVGWASGPRACDSDNNGYFDYTPISGTVGTYSFTYLDPNKPNDGWALYGDINVLRAMSPTARSYVDCNWWNSATQQTVSVGNPSCSLKASFGSGGMLAGAGNMANLL